MMRGRWYLTSLLFAVLFFHAYGPGWKMLLACAACLAIWLRTSIDRKRP